MTNLRAGAPGMFGRAEGTGDEKEAPGQPVFTCPAVSSAILREPRPDTWCAYLASYHTSSRCHLALFQPVYLLVALLVAHLVVPRLARVYLAARRGPRSSSLPGSMIPSQFLILSCTGTGTHTGMSIS